MRLVALVNDFVCCFDGFRFMSQCSLFCDDILD